MGFSYTCLPHTHTQHKNLYRRQRMANQMRRWNSRLHFQRENLEHAAWRKLGAIWAWERNLREMKARAFLFHLVNVTSRGRTILTGIALYFTVLKRVFFFYIQQQKESIIVNFCSLFAGHPHPCTVFAEKREKVCLHLNRKLPV